MPFHIQIPDAEQAYLANLRLSQQAKEALNRFVEETIANIPDEFRHNPENRPDSAKPCFKITYLLWDVWGDRRIHTIDFYVKDGDAKYGVLLLAFAELR